VSVVIWVVQALLGLVFVFTGSAKLTQPREKLLRRMAFVEDFSGGTLKFIGAVEVLGGLGLILPAWTGIAPILTPVAATGLMIVMVLAATVHARRKELSMLPVNVVMFALAAVVAWGRFGPYSY
jgi:uncharacterized membrane protein